LINLSNLVIEYMGLLLSNFVSISVRCVSILGAIECRLRTRVRFVVSESEAACFYRGWWVSPSEFSLSEYYAILGSFLK